LQKVFVESFPAFAAYWDSNCNLHRDGDTWTVHGLRSEFSHFFERHWNEASESILLALFARIEQIIAADPDDRDDVANALCTCFLENLAQTTAGTAIIPFLGPASRRYFADWNG
jgi:hypothetical protein